MKRLSSTFCLPGRKKKQLEEWNKIEHKDHEHFLYHPSNFEIKMRHFFYFFEMIPPYIKNYFFCLKYPFWRSTNVWTGKKLGYMNTWYDSIENGWVKAFGKQLSKDIKAAYKLDKKEHPGLKWKNALSWLQIKEKYGSLRLYASATKRIQDVLSHYEHLSEYYCVFCGKPAKYTSSGYILPYCSDCFEKAHDHVKKQLTTGKDGKASVGLTKKWITYKKNHRIPDKDVMPEKVTPLYNNRKEVKN